MTNFILFVFSMLWNLNSHIMTTCRGWGQLCEVPHLTLAVPSRYIAGVHPSSKTMNLSDRCNVTHSCRRVALSRRVWWRIRSILKELRRCRSRIDLISSQVILYCQSINKTRWHFQWIVLKWRAQRIRSRLKTWSSKVYCNKIYCQIKTRHTIMSNNHQRRKEVSWEM